MSEFYGLTQAQVARLRPEAAHASPVFRAFRPGDVTHSLADVSKARRLLGYAPEVDVREGIARASAWYAGNLP